MGEPGARKFDMNNSSIKTAADNILVSPIPLITDKDKIAPSGDKRDFVSLAPYFFLKDNGEIENRDGEVNPATKDYPDSEKLGQAVGNIFITSLAARLAENKADGERFAQSAISTLRAWFINEETRMTPSLEYAEMKQGETNGNWYGIIEGQGLVHVIEGVDYLKDEGLIDPDTLKGVEGWFEQYLKWLQESEKGKQAKNAPNNHGTFYDVQVAYIADFLGKTDFAATTIEEVKKRIKSQINPDGKMPLEAQRALPYDYQLYNLYAFSELASLGEIYRIDLWNWETSDGRGIKKAFEYFANQLKKVGNEPFKMNRAGEFYLAFRAASKAYDVPDYWDLPVKYYKSPLADEISAEKFGQK